MISLTWQWPNRKRMLLWLLSAHISVVFFSRLNLFLYLCTCIMNRIPIFYVLNLLYIVCNNWNWAEFKVFNLSNFKSICCPYHAIGYSLIEAELRNFSENEFHGDQQGTACQTWCCWIPGCWSVVHIRRLWAVPENDSKNRELILHDIDFFATIHNTPNDMRNWNTLN